MHVVTYTKNQDILNVTSINFILRFDQIGRFEMHFLYPHREIATLKKF